MKGLISASNHIPETDAGQRAFWDRFLVRLPLRAIEDDVAFHSMLTDATDEYEDTVGDELKVGEEEYGRWQVEIARVALPTPVLEVMSRIRRRLNEGAASPEGSDAIYVSDRRWKKVAGLLRASAYLNGRAEVNAMDLGLLRHCLWDRPEEIDSVAGLVTEELRRFDFGEDVKPRSVGRRLGDLKRRIREGTVESYDTESFEPVLYRGEYVRLEGLEEPKIALMWHGDWEALETERGTPCEVFLFDEEVSYAETRAFDDVRRCSEPAIRIDGRRYPVEHRRVSGRATRPRTPEARELHEWLEGARTLAAQAEEAAERALTRHEEGVGQTHLFVEDEFATSAYAALEHAASQLEQFRLIARGIENRVGRLS
jgi:MoxR-like ATPase